MGDDSTGRSTTTVPTTSATVWTRTSTASPPPDSDDEVLFADVMMPLLITVAVSILICAAVCFAKRRRAMRASQGTSTAITAISGGVPMSGAAYSNYNEQLSNYLATQGQGAYNPVMGSADLPPSYDEVMRSQSQNAIDKDLDTAPQDVTNTLPTYTAAQASSSTIATTSNTMETQVPSQSESSIVTVPDSSLSTTEASQNAVTTDSNPVQNDNPDASVPTVPVTEL